MKIKTYYAKSVAEAFRNIKNEFGADALILSSREIASRSAFGFRAKNAVEVVAATDADAAQGWLDRRAQGASERRPGSRLPRLGMDELARSAAEPASVRRARPDSAHAESEYNEMRRILRSLERPAPLSTSLFPDAASYELYQDLVANEVSDWLAYKLLDEAGRNLPPEAPRERPAIVKSLSEAARSLVPNAAGNDGLPRKRVVVLVGPTGVGKTTAVAKLGARLALEYKKNVLLATTDSCRVGAIEQLRTYAGLMGLPFRAAHRVSDLPGLLAENSQRDYIVVDTAGHGQRDLAPAGDLMRVLQTAADMERHLVISATTKSVDMHEIVDHFGICAPDCLLFTKLDETSTFGPIFNELVRTQKPLSYFCDGQRIPEDFHVAQPDRLIDVLLNTQ